VLSKVEHAIPYVSPGVRCAFTFLGFLAAVLGFGFTQSIILRLGLA
jgi:hypothetical protein